MDDPHVARRALRAKEWADTRPRTLVGIFPATEFARPDEFQAHYRDVEARCDRLVNEGARVAVSWLPERVEFERWCAAQGLDPALETSTTAWCERAGDPPIDYDSDRLTTALVHWQLRAMRSAIFTERLGGSTQEEWSTFCAALATASRGPAEMSMRELERAGESVAARSRSDAAMLRLAFAVATANGGAIVIRSTPLGAPDRLAVQGWMVIDSMPVPLSKQQIRHAHEAWLADRNSYVPKGWATRYRGVSSLDQQIAVPGERPTGIRRWLGGLGRPEPQ